MNVIIANKQQDLLANLNIEVIKSVTGVYSADEIVDMFSNFFFGRMILDLTALEDYRDSRNLQKISISLSVEKIIVILPPDDPETNSPQFLSKLISMGIYNFTSNIEGINYLLENPNSYRDVAHLHQIDEPLVVEKPVMMPGLGVSENPINTLVQQAASTILGFKNLTDGAGSTTLCYLLKKELQKRGIPVLAIEVGKRDFIYLNDRDLITTTEEELPSLLMKHRNIQVILLDLNNTSVDVCSDVLYLMEASYIKLNKLIMRDRKIFEKMKGKKIILSKSVLDNKDIAELEYEAKTKFFFNMPVLDDRKDNTELLGDLLVRLGISS